MYKRTIFVISILWYLLVANTTFAYTHADSLRGGNGRGRSWWDVRQYDLTVKFDTLNKSIAGNSKIFFKVTATPADSMQIDLQEPMVMDSVLLTPFAGGAKATRLTFAHEGNVWWVKYPFHTLLRDSIYSVTVWYGGVPREAVHPPWDGGISWTQDSMGKQKQVDTSI